MIYLAFMERAKEIIIRILNYIFRVSLGRLIMAFLTSEVAVIGITRWRISGKITEEGLKTVEGQISSSEADGYTVLAALVVLIGWVIGLLIYYRIHKSKRNEPKGDAMVTFANGCVELNIEPKYKRTVYVYKKKMETIDNPRKLTQDEIDKAIINGSSLNADAAKVDKSTCESKVLSYKRSSK